MKKGIYFNLIGLKNRSGEMEQREAMDLYGFFCDCALREKKTCAAVVQVSVSAANCGNFDV